MITAAPPLTFSARGFELEVDPVTGALVGLSSSDTNLLKAGCMDFTVNLDGWKIDGGRLISSAVRKNVRSDRIALDYHVVAEDGRICLAEQIFDIFDNRIERSLSVRLAKPGATEKLHSATLTTEGLVVGDTAHTQVSMPMTRSLPALDWEILANRGDEFEKDDLGFAFEPCGLDIGLATAVFSNKEDPLHVMVLPLPNECAVKARLDASREGFRLNHEFACESWLEHGHAFHVARQVFLFSTKPWQDAVRMVGDRWTSESYEPPTDRPDWARNAIILEVDLAHYQGLKGLTNRLDEIQDIGFNTLYLLPWHPGHWNGYGTHRYDQINPAYGSFRDLRNLCDEAHRRGMRVLFDLLVNVAGEDSPYTTEHPEWFYRDGTGKILWHPTWRSWCLDPASPGFRKFLTDYAVRCCTEWGADGFRVDAAAHRGGSWNNLPGIQPHQHSHAVFTLLSEIRTAIRASHPEAICMAECFGPAQVPISDLVAYQWVAWLDWANEGLLAGRLDGASLGRLLGEHFLAMPKGTWLTGYTHTHDTVAFEKRELDGPAVSALFATLTLICAGTMTFGGGWQMRERPGRNEESEYRALFAAKKMLGGIASHEITFQEQPERALLVVNRPSRWGTVRVITNFGSDLTEIPYDGEICYSRLGSEGRRMEAFDTILVLP